MTPRVEKTTAYAEHRDKPVREWLKALQHAA